MARKNNLKHIKQLGNYSRSKEESEARRAELRRAGREARRAAEHEAGRTRVAQGLEDDNMEEAVPVDPAVKEKMGEIKNKKFRRRMQNELARLAQKGIMVRAPPASKSAKTTKAKAAKASAEPSAKDSGDSSAMA
jgi:hypothetical protein